MIDNYARARKLAEHQIAAHRIGKMCFEYQLVFPLEEDIEKYLNDAVTNGEIISYDLTVSAEHSYQVATIVSHQKPRYTEFPV